MFEERSELPAPSFRPAETLPVPAVPRIQVCQTGGVWHVTKDGRFHGDFFKQEDALISGDAAAGTGVRNSDAASLRTADVPPGVNKEV